MPDRTVVTPTARPAAPGVRPWPPTPRPGALPWLVAVSGVYTVVQLWLTVPRTGLGWDETIYTSQVSGTIPAAFFSAPRARGISFLAAPVAELTTSTTALRVWMAVLSGAGLLLALWVWRNLVPVRVLALAGSLFAGLWITLDYGAQVMPNLWSAYGVMLATGCFLRAARDRTDRAALVGLVCGVTIVGLMRPPDAVWLAVPLLAVALAVPGWRRPWLMGVVLLGVVLGCGEWVVEAYVRFGGLAERLRLGSDIQGGMGLNFAVDDQIRSLDGRGLCRPCSIPWRHRGTGMWFFVLPVLAVGGAFAATAARRRATALLPLLVAVFVSVPYLFLIDYAAPRFLLPAYLLLAVPVADCLWRLVTRRPHGRLRPAVVALVAAAVGTHLAIQFSVLAGTIQNNRAQHRIADAVSATLHRAGVRPPCTVTGDSSVPVGYHAGCASRETRGADTSITTQGVRSLAGRMPVAVLVPHGQQPPPYARTWRAVPLPDRLHHAYISPTPPGRHR